MKRLLLLLPVILSALLFSCSRAPAEKESTLNVVCTSYYQYDWICRIVSDCEENISVILLNKNGTDLHSFRPSAEDIRKISECSLFVCTGGESEDWVPSALKAAGKTEDSCLSLLQAIGDRALEDEDGEKDEHIWLSLKNAEVLVRVLASSLSSLYSEDASVFEKNAEEYINELSSLDEKYEETVKNSTLSSLIVADRFPFAYLVSDYSLSYDAAFSGCSAETEASFATVIRLSEEADRTGTHVILILENSDKALAETVISNTEMKNQKILVLNSLQSINKEPYLAVMESNLEVLKEALN